jgi:hypothetical protein
LAYTHPETQRILDAEHLRLLSLFHYVSGGVTLAFSLFFGVGFVFMSAMFAFLPPPPHGPGAPELRGPPMVFFGFFAFFCALGIAYGILEIVAGRLLSLRRRRVFTLVVAIPRLLFIPYGIILSIFTLLVLERASVKQLYRDNAASV